MNEEEKLTSLCHHSSISPNLTGFTEKKKIHSLRPEKIVDSRSDEAMSCSLAPAAAQAA